MRYSSRRTWEEKLGTRHYSLTKYDVLTMTILQLSSCHLLIVSFDPDTENIEAILKNVVMPLLKENETSIMH